MSAGLFQRLNLAFAERRRGRCAAAEKNDYDSENKFFHITPGHMYYESVNVSFIATEVTESTEKIRHFLKTKPIDVLLVFTL